MLKGHISPHVKDAARNAMRRKSFEENLLRMSPEGPAKVYSQHQTTERTEQRNNNQDLASSDPEISQVGPNKESLVKRRSSQSRARRRNKSLVMSVEKQRKSRRQFYTVHFRKADFEIDVRYQNCKYLRSGAYGRVCSAVDTLDGSTVAIKKVPNMFEDLVDAKRILREIKLLLHFKQNGGHQNVVAMRDIMCGSRSSRLFEDCYIVLDKYECDLSTIINRDHTQLSKSHVQYLTYQVLAGLKFLHTAGVIHRDLKPANLLVRSNCDLVICDFGLSRGGAADVDTAKTAYVVTRYYRAPELLCRLDRYDTKVDIWSTALILAEMITGRIILKGSSTIDQLRKSLDFVPPPDENFMSKISSAAARLIREHPTKRSSQYKRGFRKAFLRRGGSKAVDFIRDTLTFDPAKRLTVQEALEHPYLKKIRKDLISAERECENVFDESFERDYPLNVEMPKNMIQNKLYRVMEELTMSNEALARATANHATIEAAGAAGIAVVAAASMNEKSKSLTPTQQQDQRNNSKFAVGAALINNFSSRMDDPNVSTAATHMVDDKMQDNEEWGGIDTPDYMDVSISRRNVHVV